MSDELMQELKKRIAESPGDNELKARWVMAKARIGEVVINTHYKVGYGNKYFSKSSYSHAWTKTGTKFPSKAAAILAIDQAFDLANRTNYRKGASLRQADIDKIELVEITTYVVAEVLNVDFVEEKSRAELGRIRKAKEELDRQEQKILKEAARKRKALIEQEAALLRKTKKGGKTSPTKLLLPTATFKSFSSAKKS